jgi:hypothetical protein
MNVIEQAITHIDRIHVLAEAGQIMWTELPTPKPTAMRAFQGQGGGYLINVAQANVVDHGVVHEGMVIAPGALVIHIPPEHADKLYHMAAAQRN